MNGKELLERMIVFDRWANAITCEALVPVAGEAGKAVALMAHIHVAWDVWIDRMHKTVCKWDIFPQVDLAGCEEIAGSQLGRWDEFLAAYRGDWVSKEFEAKLVDGRTGSFSLTDIVLQLVSHGAHHRGQVNTMIRAAGGTPPYTTFLGYILAGNG